jgi:very-long-chain enoyl-CoA reductase
MTPKVHNLVSYGVAAGVMPIVACALYGAPSRIAQWLMLLLWLVHFLRRSAEVLWVHRYGKKQFPWGDALIEYVYYWGFAAWIAFSLPTVAELDALSVGGIALFLLAELGNTRSHRILRELRSADAGAREIPRGFLFERVSCPHYLCEICSWMGFALLARTWAALAFAGLGAAILTLWATQRHRAYQKDFDGQQGRALYPPTRRALIPMVY